MYFFSNLLNSLICSKSVFVESPNNYPVETSKATTHGEYPRTRTCVFSNEIQINYGGSGRCVKQRSTRQQIKDIAVLDYRLAWHNINGSGPLFTVFSGRRTI